MDTISSSFFTLPLELREQIYRSTLASSDCGPGLLRTCREINREGLKYLYQRPLNFRSQDELHAWLANTPNHLLGQVSDLSLYLKDIDLRPVLNAKPSVNDDLDGRPRLMTWDLYETELARLEASLRRLPNVSTFTIAVPWCQHSFLYRNFSKRLLSVLGAIYPDLCDLRLNGNFHHQELEFLSSLKQLQSFSFDGFSASSPLATIGILSNLGHLKNLSLVSEHAVITSDRGILSDFTAKRPSFTGDVMHTINQLASFTVHERATTTTPASFFTSEVLTCLHEHQSLKSLSVRLSYAPEEKTLESLETCLDKNSIELLELDWPDLLPVLLEQYRLLTTKSRILWVRAVSEADAFDILWSAIECRENGDVPMLEKIVLIRTPAYDRDSCTGLCHMKDIAMHDSYFQSESPASDDCDATNIERAKWRLRGLGIHVAWYTAAEDM